MIIDKTNLQCHIPTLINCMLWYVTVCQIKQEKQQIMVKCSTFLLYMNKASAVSVHRANTL